MTTEVRSNVTQPSNGTTYDISDICYAPNKLAPPAAAGTQAQYVFTDFGKEGLSTNPDFFAFPSIANLQVVESPSAGTLTINGKFPVNQGTVQIVDISGKPTALTVTKWATDAVTATLPAGGAGSAGLVTVLDATGVPSNEVPLTQWTGILTYSEQDSIPDLDGTSGSGSGSLSANLNIDFREDVHPVVPAVDTTPMPQLFGFAYTEGDSTAQLTSYSGSYTSTGDSPHTATWSLESPAPILRPATPPLGDNTFEVRAFAPQPAPCDVADSGANNDVFCPLVGIVADPSQILCTDDDSGNLCNDNGFAGLIAYSGPFDAMGLLALTLDPSSYKVTVEGTTSSFTSGQFYDTDRPATASMTGTIDSPFFPPNPTTPAFRKAGPLRILVRRPRLGLIAPDETAAAAARPRHRR
jgi:hypothetical protein